MREIKFRVWGKPYKDEEYKKDSEMLYSKIRWEEFEIIGHKFENPELLEES